MLRIAVESMLVIRRSLIQRRTLYLEDISRLLYEERLVKKGQVLRSTADLQEILCGAECLVSDGVRQERIRIMASMILSLDSCINEVEEQMRQLWRS